MYREFRCIAVRYIVSFVILWFVISCVSLYCSFYRKFRYIVVRQYIVSSVILLFVISRVPLHCGSLYRG